MKAVKTPELVTGNWAALVHDMPNCGGIQVTRQGLITKIEPVDIWGTPDGYVHSVWMNDNVYVVHNSHTWLVREIR
jgi:hypothetical protein